MVDPSEDTAPRLPLGWQERLLVLGIGAISLGLIGLDLAAGFGRNELGLLFMLVFSVPVLVLHEFAHALAARAVGWQTSFVSLGFGRELWRFELGRARVSLRSLPIEASVSVRPRTGGATRARLAWIHLAGPLSGVLVSLGCTAGLDGHWPTGNAPLSQLALTSLGLTAALISFCSLIPHRAGGAPSDGLALLLCMLGGAERSRRSIASVFGAEAIHWLLAERPERALEVTRAGLAYFAADPELEGLSAVARAALGDAEAAFSKLENLGPLDERPPRVRARLLACAAWVVLFARDSQLSSEARGAIEQVLEIEPEDTHAEILLGRLHLEAGRTEAAYLRLMSAYKRATDLDSEAQCVAYLALACSALGGSGRPLQPQARRFAAAVAQLREPAELRERVLERLSRAASSGNRGAR